MRRATAVLAGLAGVAVVVGTCRQVEGTRARRSWTRPAGRIVDGALVARVVGDGPPSVLLLHGMFNAGRYWGAAYDGLGQPGALVVPDLLGFGRSPRPGDGYTADAHADAVAALLDELGAEGPLLVGAHSVGSLVALRLAIRRPDLVAAVVAFSPPIYGSSEAARRELASIDPLAGLFLADAALGEQVCALMCRHPVVSAALVRIAKPTLPAPLAVDRVEHSWASYSETLSNLVLAADADEWVDQIGAAVHLVAGADDEAVDLVHLEVLAARHAHVGLEVVEGAGHDLPLRHPDRCLDALRRAQRATPSPSPSPSEPHDA